ncbi:uncharacterized protein LOC116412819 isoform X1 [Galleria mellonella]|uniref:Uncharacterized protein LOC116412819 isoform X1 n=1 Tax=Galleria mellonella TaxID=7137 RepID=A0A6J3BRZ1_GALME|nr:uncharacterized protein LOC116412819 isoform X1 [Galleria mellonella]
MYEFQKRGMLVFCFRIFGISSVCSAAAGPLRTEYAWYAPLWYVYYAAGRRLRAAGRPRVRLLLLCAAHAHLVAPALCLVAVAAFGDGLDHRLVKGALVSSVGGPCVWLSLSLARPHAAALTAANYAGSLLAEPLTMLLICGRATVPPLGGVVSTVLSTLTPFALGVLRPQAHHATASKLPALLLLYVDCCERLRQAEGGLQVGDVLVTLTLEASYVCASAAWCWVYGRGGLLARRDAAALAACAVPKALAHGWQSWGACSAGLSQLPAVFLAPAQALVLAAIHDDHDDHDDHDADGEIVGEYDLVR